MTAYMNMTKSIISLTLIILGHIGCFAIKPTGYITAVTDTFQLGKSVVEISLPQNSIILIGKNGTPNGHRCGSIFLDSLNTQNHISITDASYASTTSIDVMEDGLIYSCQLPNNFVIRLFRRSDSYEILAFSEKNRLLFSWDAPTVGIAKSIIPIFRSIHILPISIYNNTKSARKKKWAKVK